jgi:hypothetical protein
MAVMITAGVLLLSGCASEPVRPFYVSPMKYQSMSCEALPLEYRRISEYLKRGVEAPRTRYSGMSWGLGSFGYDGWGWGWSPSVSYSSVESSMDDRSIYAQLLGEQDAIQQQAAYKGCPLVLVKPAASSAS